MSYEFREELRERLNNIEAKVDVLLEILMPKNSKEKKNSVKIESKDE